jgi:hypothetical protein
MWFIRINPHLVKMQENNENKQKAESVIIAQNNVRQMNARPDPTHAPIYSTHANRSAINNTIAARNAVKQAKLERQPAQFYGKPVFSHNPAPISSPIQIPQTNVTTSITKFRLFFNYYHDKNPERQKEIEYCLQKNRENPLLDVVVIESEKTPTYNFYFDRINQITGSDDINIICNSDIFFDDTIALASKLNSKDMFALSRWDWYGEGTTPNHRALKNSQDTWIIKGKVNNVNGDFCLGVPFCDNRIAYEFNRAGYKVSNPSKSIKTYHFHNSGSRNYAANERVNGQYLFIEPTEITRLPVFAMTSICPKPDQYDVQKEAILTWQNAGCQVVAFQSYEELQLFNFSAWPNVKFVVSEKSKRFPPYIPIYVMAKWAEKQNGYAFLINADCRLCISQNILQAFTNNADSGLVYLVRHDVDPNGQKNRQPYGIDGFLFPTECAKFIFNTDMLCMGKPWWDYGVPLAMIKAGKKLMSPSFHVISHTKHTQRWSVDEMYLCQSEVVRVYGHTNDHAGTGVELHNKIIAHTRMIDYNPLWEVNSTIKSI